MGTIYSAVNLYVQPLWTSHRPNNSITALVSLYMCYCLYYTTMYCMYVKAHLVCTLLMAHVVVVIVTFEPCR